MTSTSPTERVKRLDDPQLRAVVPLLYVAWADMDLQTDEREELRRRLDSAPWLRPAAREAVAEWLDPQHPPTPVEFHALGELLRGYARTASPRARQSLLLLSGEMATTDEGRDAVAELGELLGADQALPRELSHEVGLQPPTIPAPPLKGKQEISLELRAFLDGEHPEIRERVRAFLDEPARRAYGLGSDGMRDHVRGQLGELSATGLIELAFPGVTGPDDLKPFMVAFEELGHGDLSLAVKLGVQAGLYGGAVWALGTQRHHERLPAVAHLEELGCFAMSEVGHGSNVADLETTATYDPETRELVIHTPSESARKEWIGGAARDARWAAVFAQLVVDGERQGVHAVLVPIRRADGSPQPGVRTGDSGLKMGLLGVDNGRLWFEHARVPVDHLLDRFARIDESGVYQSPIENPSRRFFTMLGTLVGGRICVGSSAVSAARTSLAIAVRYATRRRQFGPGASEPERPLLDYPTHQRRLLPSVAESLILRVAFEALRDRFARTVALPDGAQVSAEPPDTRRLEAEVAALKIMGSRHGVDATQAAREACGGQGYLSVNRIADLRADVEIFTTFEGDNVVLAQLVGKALLSGYQHQFAGGGAFAIARLLARKATTTMLEKNPVQARRTESAHLRSREFQGAALRYREGHIVETLALRLRHRLKDKRDTDAAFLAVQEHVVASSQAFAERLAFDAFAEAEEAWGARLSEDAKEILRLVGDLYALSTIERHIAWFLEDGYLEASKARAVRKEVERLLAELAPHALTIIDGFGIPDACLAAPIAFFDPAHPKYF